MRLLNRSRQLQETTTTTRETITRQISQIFPIPKVTDYKTTLENCPHTVPGHKGLKGWFSRHWPHYCFS